MQVLYFACRESVNAHQISVLLVLLQLRVAEFKRWVWVLSFSIHLRVFTCLPAVHVTFTIATLGCLDS